MPLKRFYLWHLPKALDIDAMRKAAPLFVGTKDFSAFKNRSPYKDPIRSLTSLLIEDKEIITFKLQGESFLYRMARNIVGTLVYIGMGKIALSDLPLILERGDRRAAGITAPASGLVLKEVFY